MTKKQSAKGRNGLINIGAYLPPELVARVDAVCDKMHVSRRAVVQQALDRYLPEQEALYKIAPTAAAITEEDDRALTATDEAAFLLERKTQAQFHSRGGKRGTSQQ